MNRFEEIKQYKELLDEGVITQEEFDAIKKRFLEDADVQSGDMDFGSDFSALFENIQAVIKPEELKKEFVDDYKTLKKEGLKTGLKRMSAGTAVITAVIICVVIVSSLMISTHFRSESSYSGGDSYSNDYNGLSEVQMETFVEYGVIKEIQKKQSSSNWSSSIDPYSCWINANTYTREEDGVTVYGTVHLKDKYGNYVQKYGNSGDSSVNFEISLTNAGSTKSCKLD